MTGFSTFIVFVLSCGIAACVIAMFVLASQGEKKLNLKKLPSLEPRPLLDAKESSLREDLGFVCEKLGLQVFTKVSLGELLQARDEDIRGKWREALMNFEVDFAICSLRKHELLLVIIPHEHGASLSSRQNMVIRALEKVDIPYIQLGNYNRPGLEKAVKDKLDPDLLEPPPAAAEPAPAPAPAPPQRGRLDKGRPERPSWAAETTIATEPAPAES